MRAFTQQKFILRFGSVQLRSHAIQLLVCATFGLLLAFMLTAKVANALPAQPISTTIDTTEDPKAMGYPDGRKVARDAAGNLYVAYRKKYKQHLRTAYHIFVAKSTDNGNSWLVLNQGHPIESVGDQNQRVPSIAIDSHGTIHVVWYGKDGSNYANQENQIKYVSSTDQGHTWSDWRNLAYVEGYVDQPFWQEHPMLYVDEDDILYVAWEGRDSLYRDSAQVKFIRSLDGGKQWSFWENIAPSSSSHSRPTIAGNSRDSLYILAYGRVANRQQIIYSHSIDGGISWSKWTSVSPSLAEQRHVSAVTDSQGLLHVVWRQKSLSLLAQFALTKREAKTEIQYATFDGSSWSTPIHLPSSQNAAQTFPSIGVVGPAYGTSAMREESALGQTNQGDTIWIVWSETTGPYDYPNDTLISGQIYAVAKRAAGWSAPMALANGNHNIYASVARSGGSLAGKHSETIDVVWLDNQQSLKEIRFAQLTNFAQDTTLSIASRTSTHGLLSIQPQKKSIVISGVEAPYWVHWGFANFLWNSQLTRELQALILISMAVAGYVLLKFIVNRWFPALLTPTSDR